MRLHSEATDTGDDLVVENSGRRAGRQRDWKAGVGLTAMRERATELGGSCDAGPTLYGGHVVADLPAGAR